MTDLDQLLRDRLAGFLTRAINLRALRQIESIATRTIRELGIPLQIEAFCPVLGRHLPTLVIVADENGKLSEGYPQPTLGSQIILLFRSDAGQFFDLSALTVLWNAGFRFGERA